MNIQFKNFTSSDEDLFISAWDMAELMTQIVLEKFGEDNLAFLKWFKSNRYLFQIKENLSKINKFFQQDGTLKVVKSNVNSVDEYEEYVHGSSISPKSNKHVIELPKLFFNEEKFKRQADILIHEISHLAANTKDLEIPFRGGVKQESLFTNQYGQLQAPIVQRTDQYLRHHTQKIEDNEAYCCAVSYEFFIKDFWCSLPKEEKSKIKNEYFNPIKNNPMY